MSFHSSPSIILLRSLLRQLRLTPVVHLLLGTGRSEADFQDELIGAVLTGDCVWDVGANVGRYTLLFSEAVGPSGRVVAFEPSPVNREQLTRSVAGRPGVVVRAEALGAVRCQAEFLQGSDDLGATSRLGTTEATVGRESMTVSVETGDALVAANSVAGPNLIKIDTEGAERDVLKGLVQTLASPGLHTVGIEVHFGLLAERGQLNAPAEIEILLQNAGFLTRWTDASHILGRRAARVP